jgi:hypothetical protein
MSPHHVLKLPHYVATAVRQNVHSLGIISIKENIWLKKEIGWSRDEKCCLICFLNFHRLLGNSSIVVYCIYLNVHLHEIFLFSFLHLSNTYRPNNKAFERFQFCSWICGFIRIFLHSAVTQLMQSLIPCQLSQRQVRLYVNWVNAEWDSTSTESTRNDKIFVNVGVFCVNSVDVESHSTLTQLTWSLTPCLLSWRRIWLCVDSVWGRWLKPKQAYITSSGTFKGILFRKINDKMFKWGQYQLENVNSFYIAWTKKFTLH